MNLFEISFLKFTLTDLFDLILVTFIFSYAYSYFRGTRGGQMLIGLLIIFFAGFIINILGFKATSWLLNLFQTVWVVVFVILFQPEIRRLLTSVGQNRILRKLFQIERTEIQEDILSSIEEIKKQKLKRRGKMYLKNFFEWSSSSVLKTAGEVTTMNEVIVPRIRAFNNNPISTYMTMI